MGIKPRLSILSLLVVSPALAAVSSPLALGQTARRPAVPGRHAARRLPPSLTHGCYKGLGVASCYTMSISTSGSVVVHGTAGIAEGASCAKFFAVNSGGGTEVQLPILAVEDYKDELAVNLEGWKGPGTYPIETKVNESGKFVSVDLTADSKQYSELQPGAKQASGSAVVGRNGSVHVSFSGLTAHGSPGKTVSGVATYSCSDV